MVQDTLVGLLGAVLIVGSMVATIEYQDAGADTNAEVDGPPPAAGDSKFTADACEAITLVWNPATSALDDVVGPHYTPAEGPNGQGVFLLFGYDCPRTSVNSITRGSGSGGAALVAIEEPDDTRNISADGWVAAPEVVGSSDEQLFDEYDKHEFPVTEGSVSVGTQTTLTSTQARLIFDTPDGQIEASTLVTGAEEDVSRSISVVGTDADWFSAMHGEEEATRQTTGSATVETSGSTWIDELNLEPTPAEVYYDTGFSWDFTIEHEPWESNATENASTVR